MRDPNDQISDLLVKGHDLTQEDLNDIEWLLTLGDVETAYERRGSVLSAVALIVNDPLYEGDIPPMD